MHLSCFLQVLLILVQNSVNERAEYLINTMNRHNYCMADLFLLKDAKWITLRYPHPDAIRGLILQGVVIVFLQHPALLVDILEGSVHNYIVIIDRYR